MKLISKISLVVVAALVLASCGDSGSSDKDGEKGGGDFASVGGDAAKNEQVFRNVAANMETPIGGFSLNLGQLMSKSGVMDDPELGPMVQLAASEYTGAIDMNQPVRLIAEASGPMEGWAVMMIGVESGKKLKGLLSGLGKIEERKGYQMTTMKAGEYNAIIGFNDNVCMAAMTPRYAKKSEMAEYMDGLFSSAGKDGELDPMMGAFFNADQDLAFNISMGNLLEMVPAEMIQMALAEQENGEQAMAALESMKGGWSMVSLNFGDGMMELRSQNNYAAMDDMAGMFNDGLPAEYASLITDDELVGFFSTSVNLEGIMNMVESFNPGAFDEMSEEAGTDFKEILDMFDGNVVVSLIGTEGMAEMAASHDEEGEYADDEGVDESFDKFEEGAEAEAVAEVIEDMEEEGKDMMGRNLLFVMGLNNEEGLIAILDTVSKLTKEGDMYIAQDDEDDDDEPGYMVVKNGKFVITGNRAVAEQFASTGALSTVGGEAAQRLNMPIQGWFSFETLMGAIGDSMGEEAALFSLLKSGEMGVEGNEMVFRLRMANEGSNALKQLVYAIMANSDMADRLTASF